jgi:O-methyltransferase involved in polyketide biosynthesis
VDWYDVDFPDVIDLRRQLYPTRDHCTTIGAPIANLAWLDAIPTGAPVLVIGEGFFMYLAEAEALALFQRITATFPAGEFIFDAYSSPMVWVVFRLPTVKAAAVTLR